MKKLLTLAMAILCSASLALAWGGHIAVKADLQTPCAYVFTPPPGVVMSLYLVHESHTGATAVNFSALRPACFSGLWLSDTRVFPNTVGNSQTGVIVNYGSCLQAPTHVLTMNFIVFGPTPPCCYYPVQPDPMNPSGHIESVDCASQVWEAGDIPAIINPTPNCWDGICVPIPVEDTTWGRVKAMFVE